MIKKCAYSECGEEFFTKKHNQIYCSDEHRRLATSQRVMQNYYERKARKSGVERICVTPGCSTRLSRYNNLKVCAKCEAEQDAADRAKLLEMFS